MNFSHVMPKWFTRQQFRRWKSDNKIATMDHSIGEMLQWNHAVNALGKYWVTNSRLAKRDQQNFVCLGEGIFNDYVHSGKCCQRSAK